MVLLTLLLTGPAAAGAGFDLQDYRQFAAQESGPFLSFSASAGSTSASAIASSICTYRRLRASAAGRARSGSASLAPSTSAPTVTATRPHEHVAAAGVDRPHAGPARVGLGRDDLELDLPLQSKTDVAHAILDQVIRLRQP